MTHLAVLFDYGENLEVNIGVVKPLLNFLLLNIDIFKCHIKCSEPRSISASSSWVVVREKAVLERTVDVYCLKEQTYNIVD